MGAKLLEANIRKVLMEGKVKTAHTPSIGQQFSSMNQHDYGRLMIDRRYDFGFTVTFLYAK